MKFNETAKFTASCKNAMYPTKLYKLEHVKFTKMVPLHLEGLGRVIIKQARTITFN